jgi:predicted GH43/DUF377 family glycosyl hydrolase
MINDSMFLLKRLILYSYGSFWYRQLKARQRHAEDKSPHQIIIPDHSNLLEADHHFNPTIEFIENRWLMVYRIITSTKKRELAICELDENFQPRPETNINLSQFIIDSPDVQRWHSDPRFFQYKDRLFINYNDRSNHSDEISLFLLEICSRTLKPVDVPKRLDIASNPKLRRQTVEKNWQFFSHGEDLYTVYKINPHIVLKVKKPPEDSNVIYCEPVYETRMPNHFRMKVRQLLGRVKWGEPRGGTSPVLIGDTYFSFYHTAMYYSRVYSFAMYGFHAEPPFQLKYMSKEPIIIPKLERGYTSKLNAGYAVVYPCGAVYDREKGQWYVSYGLMDKELRIVVLNHTQLLSNCYLIH